jgi:hypothetical protein
VRTFLAVVTGLGALVWILLLVWASGFRRSFGASPANAALGALPIVVGALVLVSLYWPNRALLHLVAGIAVAGLLGCVWLFRKAPFVSASCALYLGCWLSYYYGVVWSPGGVGR